MARKSSKHTIQKKIGSVVRKQNILEQYHWPIIKWLTDRFEMDGKGNVVSKIGARVAGYKSKANLSPFDFFTEVRASGECSHWWPMVYGGGASGSQGYAYINDVLTPYLRGLKERQRRRQRVTVAARMVGTSPSPESILSQSEYWRNYQGKIVNAVDRFPNWSEGLGRKPNANQRIHWLSRECGFTDREAQIANKVLSELFANVPDSQDQ